MNPFWVAEELQDAVREYLRATLGFSDPETEAAFEALLARFQPPRPGAPTQTPSMWRGPYVSMQLPFLGAGSNDHGLGFEPEFPPYLHQVRAFELLHSGKNSQAQSALITTGTGSGKSECFLLPILDHALRNPGPGIQAILLYPMNALATDQALRLAGLIYHHKKLRGRVSAGLYVGGAAQSLATMGPEHILQGRDILRKNPPQILMTNYKMLDLLLQRPEDQPLFRGAEASLRYLVLDEVHTYDGAQGSDVACLIRRLRHRLKKTDPFSLSCVGTSATLGSGPNAKASDDLRAFASQLFGQAFPPESVVEETRLDFTTWRAEAGASEGLGSPDPDPQDPNSPDSNSPDPNSQDSNPQDPNSQTPNPLDPSLEAAESGLLRPKPGESADAYARRQVAFWFEGSARDSKALPEKKTSLAPSLEDPLHLGRALRAHPRTEALLKKTPGAPVALETLVDAQAKTLAFADWPRDRVREALLSFLSLLAYARRSPPGSPDAKLPLVSIRVQLLVRELSRLSRAARETPQFFWRDDQPRSEEPRALPPAYCELCGEAGWWAEVRSEDLGAPLDDEPRSIYQAFNRRSPHLVTLHPGEDPREEQGLLAHLLEPKHLRVVPKERSELDAEGRAPDLPSAFPVFLQRDTEDSDRGHARSRKTCPRCGTRFGMRIVGSQGARLLSVLVGQLFASPRNQDRKLLVFTDSVQDAAHRAGFLGTQPYRFFFRSLLATCLEELESERKPGPDPDRDPGVNPDHSPEGEASGPPESLPSPGIPLEDLAPRLLPRLTQSDDPQERARALAEILPPDLDRLSGLAEVLAKPTPAKLKKIEDSLAERLHWEVLREFGLYARLGRSLEKVGAAVAFVEPAILEASSQDLHQILVEEIPHFFDRVPARRLRQFLWGILTRLRHRGGILHGFFRGYLESGGNTHLASKSRIPTSPGAGKGRRPVYWQSGSAPNFDRVPPSAKSSGWYPDWARRCLHQHLFDDDVRTVYERALEVLLRHGALREFEGPKQSRVFALDPQVLRLTRRVAALGEGPERQGFVVAEAELAWLDGIPSQKHRDPAAWTRQELPRAAFYRSLYGRAVGTRIFASEHSGLLDRETREAVEQRFKADPSAQALNLLACTPTLEMGIDVGNLSATVLASVPPQVSNFVQRIGRAGRKTGNALVVTMVQSKPHDLYFYQRPESLLAGQVDPPGCFLGAPEVLVRHLLAFVFDRWVAEVPGARVPRKMREAAGKNRKDCYPLAGLAWAQTEAEEIFDAFQRLFPDLPFATKGQIQAQLAEGRIRARVEAALEAFRDSQKQLRNQLNGIRKKLPEGLTLADLRGKTLSPEEEMQRDALREKIQIERRLTEADQQNPIAWMVLQGFLPNYAFPEAGVELETCLLEGKAADGSFPPPRVETLERPARSALSELAPGQMVFALGYQVQVDEVDPGPKGAAIEAWRVCASCPYQERETEDTPKQSCPRCGHHLWADPGQRLQVLPLKRVRAQAWADKARIRDQQDERIPRNFALVHGLDRGASDSSSLGAGESARWALSDGRFGFEYLDRAQDWSLNLGVPAPGQGSQVGGESKAAKPFRVCLDCGRVEGSRDFKNKGPHKSNCGRKDLGDKAFEAVALGRRVETEAVRISPFVESFAGTQEALATLRAALSLGLKRRLKGQVAHLAVRELFLPSRKGAESRRPILALVDTVPGGTGFLRDLVLKKQGEGLKRVFEAARDALEACACAQDPEVRACYGCLYAHRFGRDLERLDRALGVRILTRTLELWDQLEAVEDLWVLESQGGAESELEERFWADLCQAVGRFDQAEVHPQPQSAAELAWGSTVAGSRVRWRLTAQPRVKARGVATQPDFLLERSFPPDATTPKVYVYLDGFGPHVKPGEAPSGLEDDLIKREALRQAGHVVFCMSWWDLPNTVGKDSQALAGLSRLDANGFSPSVKNYLRPLERGRLGPGLEALRKQGPFELLLAFLQDPDPDFWKHRIGGLLAGAVLGEDPMARPSARGVLKAHLESLAQAHPETQDLDPASKAASISELPASLRGKPDPSRMAPALHPPGIQPEKSPWLAVGGTERGEGGLALSPTPPAFLQFCIFGFAKDLASFLNPKGAGPGPGFRFRKLGALLWLDDRFEARAPLPRADVLGQSSSQGFQRAWRSFWHEWNWLQFWPGFRAVLSSTELELAEWLFEVGFESARGEGSVGGGLGLGGQSKPESQAGLGGAAVLRKSGGGVYTELHKSESGEYAGLPNPGKSISAELDKSGAGGLEGDRGLDSGGSAVLLKSEGGIYPKLHKSESRNSAGLPNPEGGRSSGLPNPIREEYAELRQSEDLEPRLLPFLDLAEARGLEAPAVFPDLNQEGQSQDLPLLDLAWVERRVAILEEVFPEDKSLLEPKGWILVSIEDVEADPEAILLKLESQPKETP